MKTMLFIGLMLVSGLAMAQKTAKTDTIYIHTSALCGECKDRIESALNYQKGVKFAELNLETKIAMAVYKPKKVKPETLRLAISEAGYDADDVKANPASVKRLPKCCQPNGH